MIYECWKKLLVIIGEDHFVWKRLGFPWQCESTSGNVLHRAQKVCGK